MKKGKNLVIRDGTMSNTNGIKKSMWMAKFFYKIQIPIYMILYAFLFGNGLTRLLLLWQGPYFWIPFVGAVGFILGCQIIFEFASYYKREELSYLLYVLTQIQVVFPPIACIILFLVIVTQDKADIPFSNFFIVFSILLVIAVLQGIYFWKRKFLFSEKTTEEFSDFTSQKNDEINKEASAPIELKKDVGRNKDIQKKTECNAKETEIKKCVEEIKTEIQTEETKKETVDMHEGNTALMDGSTVTQFEEEIPNGEIPVEKVWGIKSASRNALK